MMTHRTTKQQKILSNIPSLCSAATAATTAAAAPSFIDIVDTPPMDEGTNLVGVAGALGTGGLQLVLKEVVRAARFARFSALFCLCASSLSINRSWISDFCFVRSRVISSSFRDVAGELRPLYDSWDFISSAIISAVRDWMAEEGLELLRLDLRTSIESLALLNSAMRD